VHGEALMLETWDCLTAFWRNERWLR